MARHIKLLEMFCLGNYTVKRMVSILKRINRHEITSLFLLFSNCQYFHAAGVLIELLTSMLFYNTGLSVSGSSDGSTTSMLFYNTGLSLLVEAQTVVRPPCYSITLASLLVEAQTVVRPPCYSITLASLC